MNQLAPVIACHVPAPVVAAGARILSLPRILHRADQETERVLHNGGAAPGARSFHDPHYRASGRGFD